MSQDHNFSGLYVKSHDQLKGAKGIRRSPKMCQVLAYDSYSVVFQSYFMRIGVSADPPNISSNPSLPVIPSEVRCFKYVFGGPNTSKTKVFGSLGKTTSEPKDGLEYVWQIREECSA